MVDSELPRTRLDQLMKQKRMTLRDLMDRYREITGTEMSERQAYRWVNGDLKKRPYAHAQAALEQIFGEAASRLLGPAVGSGLVLQASPMETIGLPPDHERYDWQRQVIARSAMRAREFLSRTEVSNVGTETLDQLTDDVRRLTVAYQQEPLEALVGDMSETQNQVFGLLEGRQRPKQSRDLYLLAGVASGLMARASHDIGASDEAMVHARAAFAAADNAGHDGLKAWVKGLQSLIAYWAGRYSDSIKYARQGGEFAERSRNTSAVWLASGEARSLAALGQFDDAREAVDRATEARELVRRDDLDDLGGFCTFNRPRQLYYAAEALAWAGSDAAASTERFALEAIAAYETAPAGDRAFGDEAGTRCALAVARIARSEFDGAADAMTEVLELPTGQRTHGVVTAVGHVQRSLAAIEAEGRALNELGDSMRAFTSQRLALPQ
ncbi:helix-turn-helix domain-containing protein [Amycolatopsis roodepoortensis]|uniref:Transcriptional regulator with XRE-family HTH domain n=1 Tax=Amycolatopsis roodepoortensis TaxID=700274 RepID=A0ABR9L1L4_9PSEU|nr:helix-turn-helix transcriptional regulator [Amycolatopsis roodepoortensis]MBE1574514.1 transcriptional regulator with XRE-family HTH domain [Amycolatopsis roodepoortensis]